jgi:hypothetical protein
MDSGSIAALYSPTHLFLIGAIERLPDHAYVIHVPLAEPRLVWDAPP